MLLEKIRKAFSFLSQAEKNKLSRCALLLIFVFLFFATRIPYLSKDTINPDGVNWHYRSQQFVVGLKFLQFEKTYQHYHPGVTLMWVTGIPIEIFKQVTNIKDYNLYNFQAFDFIAKFSLVIVQLVLSLLVIYALSKIVGFNKSFLTVVFFSFEPFFVGNSRLYHMDTLLSILLFLAIIFSFLNLKNPSFGMSLLSGLFLALSFLTKSVSIGAVLFVVLYALAYFVYSKQYKSILPYVAYTLFFFVLFTFLLFPALWENPIYYLSLIFKEAARVGIRKGHGQVVFGEYTRDPGFWFYPLVLLVKTSPFTIIGCILFVVSSIKSLVIDVKENIKNEIKMFKDTKKKFLNFGFYIAVFYLGYVFSMSFPTKKIDRYMLVVYPFMAYLAVVGYGKVFLFLKSKVKKLMFWSTISLLCLVFWVMPFVRVYPYYFTYTSPLFINSQTANKIVAQKPFGIGMYDLKELIVKRYGSSKNLMTPKLAFVDTKPMKSIYPNSKVFDVRVSGPGQYDLLVLGVNEDIPENIENSKYTFEKDASMWINGLEYWRIYVKKEK
ncbi:glycosyltransferase family 39 protein [candidate division WWE3 bacterium]|uniref:Glycosyltransferase family 39 protein n=1 Tax=candidate division WWE3 bacterium TaxID=2053526 RepID=A0A7X9E6U5_UNCKA|nr:glycosyltransferase family 39 protein [candidate division WWE3 bacterium]